ncbi:MAG: sigma-70 family RNA polymerase sigma factor [Parachlamydia sp.]|nr:sigma-70 family RNA polymerase sigma factor [Parachlamydia sp.]
MTDAPLTDEQRALVEKNINLAHFAANKYFRRFQFEYEDLLSICYYGLIKAAQYFDVSKGFKFSTYAMKMMFGYIQKEAYPRKPQIKTLYLEDLLFHDADGKHMDWEQIFSDNASIENEILENVLLEQLAHNELVYLDSRLIKLLQCLIADPHQSQHELAEKMGVSQPHVCRLRNKLRKRIETALTM